MTAEADGFPRIVDSTAIGHPVSRPTVRVATVVCNALRLFRVNDPAPRVNQNPLAILAKDVAFICASGVLGRKWKPAMPTSLVCFDRGSGFSAGSLVIWSFTALPTIYVSCNQLRARVPSANIASHSRFWIAVSNGAVTSNVAYFAIINPAVTLPWRLKSAATVACR